MGETHHKFAKSIRHKEYYQTLPLLSVQEESMFPHYSEHPIVFEEVYVKNKEMYESLESQRNQDFKTFQRKS